MTYRELIFQSAQHLSKYPVSRIDRVSNDIFTTGAKWMFDRLNELDNHVHNKFDHSIKFGRYGLLKYGICLSAFIVSGVLLFRSSVFLVPLSVVVFYLFEVHFLFLFPLLIDQVKNPIRASISQTYKIGLVRSFATVVPIAFFMLIGLFNAKDPFRNWHIGSLAVVIWYKNEIRNRL